MSHSEPITTMVKLPGTLAAKLGNGVRLGAVALACLSASGCTVGYSLWVVNSSSDHLLIKGLDVKDLEVAPASQRLFRYVVSSYSTSPVELVNDKGQVLESKVFSEKEFDDATGNTLVMAFPPLKNQPAGGLPK